MQDLWCTPQEIRRLERLCAVLSGDPDAGADLAQETLLQAWRIRDRLVSTERPGPWLDAVARHVCRRSGSRRARLHRGEALGDDVSAREAEHDPIDALLERDELTVLLDRALASLPPESRSLLVQRYVEDLAAAEIAEETGLSPDAVAMRLVRARARLRDVIERDLSDEPLARIWLDRHGAAWRRTRLGCAECGRRSVAIRRDPRRSVIELRCDSCHRGDHVDAAFSTVNPVLGPLLEGLVRPSALLARAAVWGADYWGPATSAGRADCTGCGHAVEVSTYRRQGQQTLRRSRGWWVGCARCGEELSQSVAGAVLQHPRVRALRADRPGVVFAGEREERRGSRTVTVVALRDPSGGAGAEAVVADDEQGLALLDVRRAR